MRLSVDGRGRWMDNVFIARLWRRLKNECVFLGAFETRSEARSSIGSWMDHHDQRRRHSTFGGRALDEVYAMTEELAAWKPPDPPRPSPPNWLSARVHIRGRTDRHPGRL